MDVFGTLASDLLARLGVVALLLLGAAWLILAQRTRIRELEQAAREIEDRTQARIDRQDTDHERDRAAWTSRHEWQDRQIRDLQHQMETERRARWAAEDAARRHGGDTPATAWLPPPDCGGGSPSH